MNNKNLIYLICDNSYKELLNFNIDNILNNISDEIDICIICPEDFRLDEKYLLKNIFLFKQENFDYRHTAKFTICKFQDIEKYKNLLYIDCDAIITKNISSIFECINSNHNIIHGIREIEDFDQRINDPYFRFTSKSFEDNQIGFNCGTFGFNIKMRHKINELLDFCLKNKNLALCDQPLYNEFLIENKLIENTLSSFVYFYCQSVHYDKMNSESDCSIIHFLGNAYQGKHVDNIKSIINKLK